MVNGIIIVLVVLIGKLSHAVYILNGNKIYRKDKPKLALYEFASLAACLTIAGANATAFAAAVLPWMGMRWIGDYALNKFLGHDWHYLPEPTASTTAWTDRLLNKFKGKEARLAIRIVSLSLCLLIGYIIQQYA